MKSYFKYLYYRYFFYYDPTHAWCKQSLKVVITCIIATSVAIAHPDVLVLWLVLPALLLMLMVDITQTLPKRLLFLILQGLLALFAIVSISLILAVSWILAAGCFLLMAFISLYVANNKPLYLRVSTAFLVYLLIALVKPIPLNHINIALVYTLIALVISLLVTVSFWPLPLKKQIRHNIEALELILGRFITASINDAIRGNYSVNIRQLIREKLLLMLISLEKLNATYQVSVKDDYLEKQISLLKELCYKAIALENTFNNLPRQSYLCAPLGAVQQVAINIKILFDALPAERIDAIKDIEHAIQQLKLNWDEQMKIIKATHAPVIQNLLHWSQVTYLLDRIFCSLEAWFIPAGEKHDA